jgi:hypothetical protein
MRFYVNELNIDLLLPATVKFFHENAGVIVSSQDINYFINDSNSHYSLVFKQLNAFKCNNGTIMNDWIKHISDYKSTSINKILNAPQIRQELVSLYNEELKLRESKIPNLKYKLIHMLNYYDRLQFMTGDMLEYTTTISYKDNTVPSKIYRHRIIIS